MLAVFLAGFRKFSIMKKLVQELDVKTSRFFILDSLPCYNVMMPTRKNT